jgi:hypothetical protein
MVEAWRAWVHLPSFWLFFYVLYSTLLHLLPVRLHWVGGCRDRIQDCRDFGIQTLLPLSYISSTVDEILRKLLAKIKKNVSFPGKKRLLALFAVRWKVKNQKGKVELKKIYIFKIFTSVWLSRKYCRVWNFVHIYAIIIETIFGTANAVQCTYHSKKG